MGFKADISKQPSGRQVYNKIVTLAKQMGLNPKKSHATDVWRAVLRFAKNKPYVAGGPTPSIMILNNHWNCEALSYLIIYLTSYVRDSYLNPLHHTGGWNESKGRHISKPGLNPNMVSIKPPNVSLDGKKQRYTFKSHMWASIDNMNLDPITGLAGPQVKAAWPIVVPKNNIIHSLGLTSYELVRTRKRPNGMEEFDLIPQH